MSEEETEENNDAREVVASIFDGAAATATAIASMVPDAGIKTALSIGGGIARVVGRLIRRVGTSNADALIKELVERRDEGIITAKDLREDDASIAKAVEGFFKEGNSND